MSSRVSVAAGAAGGVPLRTTNDVDGNAVFGKVTLYEAGGVAVPVTPQAPLPVGVPSGPLHDASGAVGTVSAPVLAAGARTLLDLQNVGSVAVALNFGAAATAGIGSIILQPGGSLRYGAPGFVPSDVINAIAAGTGGALTVKWA